jgi:hypothetical protein
MMTQTTKPNPKIISRVSIKSILAKAKALVERDNTRRQFERVMYELSSTVNMTIFNYDCVRYIPSLSKKGPEGWSAIEAKKSGDSLFIPFEPRSSGDQNSTRAFFIRHFSLMKMPHTTYSFLMDNKSNFAEIRNIDNLLMQILDIMQEAYDKRIPINPFQSFLLEFPEGTREETIGTAKLAMCIPDPKPIDLDNWVVTANNIFLNIFIGHNFWDNVVKNTVLEEKVLKCHHTMIADRKRKSAA